MLAVMQFIFSRPLIYFGTFAMLFIPVILADYAFNSIKVIALAYIAKYENKGKPEPAPCGCQHCN